MNVRDTRQLFTSKFQFYCPQSVKKLVTPIYTLTILLLIIDKVLSNFILLLSVIRIESEKTLENERCKCSQDVLPMTGTPPSIVKPPI